MDEKGIKSSGKLQARIIVSTLSYNNSIMIVDENGESHKPIVPDPVEEEFLVKSGDQVNGFEIVNVIENFIELKSYAEYTTDSDSTPNTQFVIQKGECINLKMYGVFDAVHKTVIRFVETVEYIVTKADWNIEPMPEKNAQFTIKRKFTEEQIKRLKKGHIPEEMEDRWFYYYEDGKIYFHRSWSGNCIFIVEFNFKTNMHLVTVNRDENQYSNTDIDEDIELINELL